MKKNTNPAANGKRGMSTKALAYCALLAALSVVFARLIIPMPYASTRFSIEAVPIFISGMLFGPMAGGLVGFSADIVGCLFSGYGFNPIFSIPPILYGVFAGIFRRYLAETEKMNILRLIIAFLPPIVFGSILYQSAALAFIYNSEGSFWLSYKFFLSTRSIQFAVTMALDVVIIFYLFKTGLFTRLGVWPPKSKNT